MTILNDKEIRMRSMVPTHSFQGKGNRSYYSKVGDIYYSLANGKGYAYPNPESLCIFPLDVNDPIFQQKRMITPFNEKLSEVGKISHGLSSFGYDATCGRHFKIAANDPSVIIDPKNIDPRVYYDFEGDVCVIPPHGFALTYTNEIFDIPENILAICMAKSTYARCALVVGVTPLEPGWRGAVTIELSNTTDMPIKVYSGEGICQFLFIQGNSDADVPYNKRGGKYMDQVGIVLPRILQA